eukprot:106826-Chlamydomonas_euryale.AAC.3
MRRRRRRAANTRKKRGGRASPLPRLSATRAVPRSNPASDFGRRVGKAARGEASRGAGVRVGRAALGLSRSRSRSRSRSQIPQDREMWPPGGSAGDTPASATDGLRAAQVKRKLTRLRLRLLAVWCGAWGVPWISVERRGGERVGGAWCAV